MQFVLVYSDVQVIVNNRPVKLHFHNHMQTWFEFIHFVLEMSPWLIQHILHVVIVLSFLGF